MKNNINYATVQQAVAKNSKQKIELIIFLYKTWAKESDRLASLAENPYGATGFTIGKFVKEWSDTLEFEDEVATARSFKARIQEVHQCAQKNIDLKTIVNTTVLAKNAAPSKPAVKVVTKPAKPSAKRLAKLAEILMANGATKAEVAYLIK